jgi:hypothetical protein
MVLIDITLKKVESTLKPTIPTLVPTPTPTKPILTDYPWTIVDKQTFLNRLHPVKCCGGEEGRRI